MKEEILSKLIPDAIRKTMTQKEIETLLEMDSSDLKQHIAQYIRQKSDCIENRTSAVGEYILPIQSVAFTKSFYPSATARRSFLHLLTLTDVVYGQGYSTTRKNLPAFFLTQTFSGAGYLEYMGRGYQVHPGDVMLIDCRREHHFRADSPEGWGYRLAYFDGLAMPDMFSLVSANGNYVLPMNKNDFPRFFSLFSCLFDLNTEDAPENEYRTNCILTQMITELLDRVTPSETNQLPSRIEEIASWLTFHCCETITLDTVAEQFNISKFHLSREFKRYMGVTVFQYLTDARLLRAKELLRHTELPVSWISESTQLGSPNAFARLFKQKEDITPSSYRKQWKGI